MAAGKRGWEEKLIRSAVVSKGYLMPQMSICCQDVISVHVHGSLSESEGHTFQIEYNMRIKYEFDRKIRRIWIKAFAGFKHNSCIKLTETFY